MIPVDLEFIKDGHVASEVPPKKSPQPLMIIPVICGCIFGFFVKHLLTDTILQMLHCKSRKEDLRSLPHARSNDTSSKQSLCL